MQRVQALRLFSGWLPMLEACHRRYGDVFRLHVPALGPVVVLADPDLIRSVYADPETTTGGTATTAFLRRLVHDLYETPTVGWMHGGRAPSPTAADRPRTARRAVGGL